MAPSSKSRSSTQAELVLLPTLKSCLVNLPASLVAILQNANTFAQDVVVELSFRPPPPPGTTDRPAARSVFVGWTGMPAKRKLAPVVSRDGLAGSRGNALRETDVATVEVDPVFARLVGLTDGVRLSVSLHVDPPQAHTINIEPLTAADWEMIELHAQFLELNFLSQVRALPNPAVEGVQAHPITLHLSPTSTASVLVVSLQPAPPGKSAFVKIAPDAEIIVAPKERQRERRDARDGRSSGSKKSVGGRSGASTVRKKSGGHHSSKGSLFLRGIDRGLDADWFDEEDMVNDGLKVWVDRELLQTKPLKGVQWVAVSLVKPNGVMEKADPQKASEETEKPATKIVARLGAWDDAPDIQHSAMSSMLCQSLCAEKMVGGLIKIEPAPTALDPASVKSKDSSMKVALKVIPFIASGITSANTGLKFGGESKQEKDESARNLKNIFGKAEGNGLLDGPLSEGMLLPEIKDKNWHGGILRFHPPIPQSESNDGPVAWLLAQDKSFPIDFQPEIARPNQALRGWSPGDPLPEKEPILVGVDKTLDQLLSDLAHSSSTLLTGGLGSGKTNVAQLIAHRLQKEYLFHCIYFPCRTKMMGEYKVSNIKETLERLFAAAAWGARSGGRSIIILDDLDSVCLAETELGEGGDNVRSRHVSEALCAITRQFCTLDSGVVLLATAQSKESLNNIIIGGHVVREITNLSAPNKDMRRKVLESLVKDSPDPMEREAKTTFYRTSSQSSNLHDGASTPSENSNSRPSTSEGPSGFTIDPSTDFLDLAGQTDGYMPGDLVLLTSRARSECLIRTIAASPTSTSTHLTLTPDDFSSALKGFTPASLRNVTLQTSTVKWSAIGGLHATRQILLETLQYPTTYAPIFSQCPLRLRSGILLYGFPGCGKTLLASAISSECGLNFISVKGPEILNKYIGASEKSVRDLFERAQAARPCVLFFDEFDAIAPKRGHDSTGVTDRVVNQLLTQMDGAEGLEGVYVLAATSRPDLIDPALLRPGRLDKSIICGMPDAGERQDILKAVARGLRVDEEVHARWAEVADRTSGLSGADLQALVYNAQLEAVHDVLGDTDPSAGKNSTNGSTKRAPDFDIVRLGDPADLDTHSPKMLAERALTAAKLRDMAALKRKQRAASEQRSKTQHQRTGSGAVDSADEMFDAASPARGKGKEKEESEDTEPVIMWTHLQKSLGSTRASISAQERRRLERIYREFVDGRSGDLPSGQGGNEIGGRTSLM
ncbi:AAA-domain-containing protein [Microthyrium microscopicum]|uniref:Peroxisomal ATPase PEX1 n=1 Tax=Microthyrium microscopicum TaxID=703497 RepID=A0A6A6U274_9PEZI|nr:AAA-domain-containing protein [Microthyrium microscopicum]